MRIGRERGIDDSDGYGHDSMEAGHREGLVSRGLCSARRWGILACSLAVEHVFLITTIINLHR